MNSRPKVSFNEEVRVREFGKNEPTDCVIIFPTVTPTGVIETPMVLHRSKIEYTIDLKKADDVIHKLKSLTQVYNDKFFKRKVSFNEEVHVREFGKDESTDIIVSIETPTVVEGIIVCKMVEVPMVLCGSKIEYTTDLKKADDVIYKLKSLAQVYNRKFFKREYGYAYKFSEYSCSWCKLMKIHYRLPAFSSNSSNSPKNSSITYTEVPENSIKEYCQCTSYSGSDIRKSYLGMSISRLNDMYMILVTIVRWIEKSPYENSSSNNLVKLISYVSYCYYDKTHENIARMKIIFDGFLKKCLQKKTTSLSGVMSSMLGRINENELDKSFYDDLDETLQSMIDCDKASNVIHESKEMLQRLLFPLSDPDRHLVEWEIADILIDNGYGCLKGITINVLIEMKVIDYLEENMFVFKKCIV